VLVSLSVVSPVVVSGPVLVLVSASPVLSVALVLVVGDGLVLTSDSPCEAPVVVCGSLVVLVLVVGVSPVDVAVVLVSMVVLASVVVAEPPSPQATSDTRTSDRGRYFMESDTVPCVIAGSQARGVGVSDSRRGHGAGARMHDRPQREADRLARMR
jgi:hypothetical protein